MLRTSSWAPRPRPPPKGRTRAQPRVSLILHLVGPGPGALAAPEIAREIAGYGRRVEVILAPETRHFIGPAAFENHVVDEPCERPEAVLFAPATAGILARLARGLDGSFA